MTFILVVACTWSILDRDLRGEKRVPVFIRKQMKKINVRGNMWENISTTYGQETSARKLKIPFTESIRGNQKVQ